MAHTKPQPRLPTKGDFLPNITLDILPPPNHHTPLNILLLLHGLGDTQSPFTSFGSALQLPYTAIVSLRAPSPIPALITGSDVPSFHWGDDLVFDSSTGEIDIEGGGFVKSGRLVSEEVVERVLVAKCGFGWRDVVVLGYGQGGSVALGVAVGREQEIGGVISIGGRLAASAASATLAGDGGGKGGEGKAKTPVLVLGGSRSMQVTRSAVDGLKERFGDVEYVKWAKVEDSMPRNREEMVPIMRFLAKRLRSRAGVPEGAVELG